MRTANRRFPCTGSHCEFQLVEITEIYLSEKWCEQSSEIWKACCDKVDSRFGGSPYHCVDRVPRHIDEQILVGERFEPEAGGDEPS